jgi:hypothetical protein
MLARAPGDVTCANAAQLNVPAARTFTPRRQRSQLRRERTPAAGQRTRAAHSAQISQRRAAGMRDDLCKQALDTIDDVIGSVIRRDRLGGLLHEYAQVA